MATDFPSDETRPPRGDGPEAVKFWRTQLGQYHAEFKPWTNRCTKIIRRYRDERPEATENLVKFNVLWSNVETLGPAIYSRPPQPIVERRYLDQDLLANVASMTLERGIETQLDLGKFNERMKGARLDYLLCGRAQLWVRYEPEYAYSDPPVTDTGTEEEEASEEQAQEVGWEKVCVDYVHWSDFAHSTARVWEEVWWVARRCWVSRQEGIKRWGSFFGTIGLQKPGDADADVTNGRKDRSPKAEVWEIWDKNARQVIFMAADYPDKLLEVADDPLHLTGFWPCPEPLYATTTNDTLVPVPDYAEYQDQAEEIDRLTARIAKITAAIKAVGLYDAAADGSNQLSRLLQEGTDNMMLPVTGWAAFAEKGGLQGTVDFLPIKDLVAALMSLYEARAAAKADLFEITGMSDIIRGQSTGAAKTATEQRIKGQFASMRLEDRRKSVARFVRDAIAIVGEIIAEQFSPEILVEMTGMLPVVKKMLPTPQEQPPAPQMGHNGGPPMGAPMGPQGPMPPQLGGPQMMPGVPPGLPVPAPQPDPDMLAVEVLGKALELLRNDKMRTFRIDIETDSTVEADAAMQKEEVTEFMAGSSQFLNGILPVVQLAPMLLKPFAETFMAATRRMRFGRQVETAFEEAFEQLEEMTGAQGQGGPTPEEEAAQIKGQAEQVKAKAQVESTMLKSAAEQQRMQMEARMAEMQGQLDEMKMMLDAKKLQLEGEKIEMEGQVARHKALTALTTPTPKPNGSGQRR